MVECVESWVGQIVIEKGVIKGDEDKAFLVFDDSWLKLAQLMWSRERKRSRSARNKLFLEKNAEEWSKLARESLKKQKEIINRAGESLCQYAGLDEDTTIHFRDNDAITIAQYLDAIQVFIPAPVTEGHNESKLLQTLADDKAKLVTILAEVLEASANTMKEYEDILVGMKLRQDELQPMHLLLIEDILFGEFNFDFEDFKQTVMHHELLKDQLITGQIGDALMQTQEYFQEKFYESD